MRTGGTDPPGQYLLLDGHLRIEALKELGREETLCLIATDDESYNYNHKVNRLVPIQEHFMILRALERGISEERIARALRVDVAHIREKRYLLRGICTEVVVLLKEAPIAASALRHLRAVKPTRQVAIAEMMNLVGNYSSTYCQALVAATPQEQRVRARKRSAKMALSATEVARMQREEDALQRGWQAREETYGQDFLNLVVARGYVSRLLGNTRVMQFLSGQYPDLLEGLRQIAESASLEG
jgi:ParB-like chromosome segregation protein Spo0J